MIHPILVLSRTSFLPRAKKVFVLLGVLVAVIGIFAAPRIRAALFTYVYPADKDVLVDRFIEPERFFAVRSGSAITITVVVTNSEDVALRGFYYSDQVPNGWGVRMAGVAVNGSPVEDFVIGRGYPDQVYPGFTPHRWVLEVPQGDGVFSPTHPISASIGTAQITYAMVVSGSTGSDYVLGYEAWAGWLETVSDGNAVFGHLGITKTIKADFDVDPRSGAIPLTVQFTDLSVGDPTAWVWDFGDGSAIDSRQHPTHTYTLTGTYAVTLTAVRFQPATATRAQPAQSAAIVKYELVTVTLPPLRADFSAQPRFGPPPLTVRFADLSLGDILTHTWDLGRGGTVSVPVPTYTYPTSGYYTVTLTVHDVYRSNDVVRPRYIHVTDDIRATWLPAVLSGYTVTETQTGR